MEITVGTVVFSKAGRDKRKMLLVIKTYGNYAYVCDGDLRKVDKPKKKKLIHISPTGTVIEGSIKTNPQIRKILNNFRKSEG